MPPEIAAIIRAALIAVGSILTAHGWVDQGRVEALAGAALVVIAVAWSIVEKRILKKAVVDTTQRVKEIQGAVGAKMGVKMGHKTVQAVFNIAQKAFTQKSPASRKDK